MSPQKGAFSVGNASAFWAHGPQATRCPCQVSLERGKVEQCDSTALMPVKKYRMDTHTISCDTRYLSFKCWFWVVFFFFVSEISRIILVLAPDLK